MVELKVPDMHCENCVARISKALGALNVSFSISLEDKTVSLNADEAQLQKVIEALDDLGFDAEK
jgi:copper chaperone